MMTVLRVRRYPATAVRVGEAMLEAREIEFVPRSEVFVREFETFQHEADTALSFADSAITTLARRHPPGFVATFDVRFARIDGVTVVP